MKKIHGNRKHFGCKVEGCHNNQHFCRGFCRKHYTAFYKGQITLEGESLPHYNPRPVNKNRKCKYPGCDVTGDGRKNVLRKDLCNRHRKWAEKGIITWDCEILQPDRITEKKKPEMVVVDGQVHIFKKKCSVTDCLKEARRNGLCSGHSSSFREGRIDKTGNPLYERKYYDYDKDKCSVEGCTKNAKKLVKGMCKYHYNKQRKENEHHGRCADNLQGSEVARH